MKVRIALVPLLLSGSFALAQVREEKPSDNIVAIKPADAFTPVKPADSFVAVKPSDMKASEGVISGVKPVEMTAVPVSGATSAPKPSKASSAPSRLGPAADIGAGEGPGLAEAPEKAGIPTPAAPAGPTGPSVTTGENTMTLRGTVVSVDGVLSVTILRKTGQTVTYQLAPGTKLPPGLNAGSPVRVRARLDLPGRIADRVDRDDAPPLARK